ncbi:hypothetical protein K7X08_010123 [Anisodus acutangulus]|uniref:GIY-YIG domain-containing protein n=1 Tax=Anisodus acutangulus TaxID=402998 RepID=A0A9Q1N0J7_9SOLA|nr:hypothetical protein K7X08_010123 [Anisodus acutangulus]
MARPLSTIFKSSKPHILKPPKSNNLNVSSSSNPSESSGNESELLTSPASNSTKCNNNSKKCDKTRCLWCVYLILSTNPPIKTYIGVTTNFSRRLKEHNGELKGGAKASRSGRPWICACLIRGFKDRSEACAFESKWKHISRKLPRKRKTTEEQEQKPEDNGSSALLQHKHAALDRVQSLIDCSDLNIDWRSNFF